MVHTHYSLLYFFPMSPLSCTLTQTSCIKFDIKNYLKETIFYNSYTICQNTTSFKEEELYWSAQNSPGERGIGFLKADYPFSLL